MSNRIGQATFVFLLVVAIANNLLSFAAWGEPGFDRLVIVPGDPEKAFMNAYPCLAKLDDGRLFMVWTVARPKSEDLGVIVGAFSSDHGRTWSPPVTLLGESGRRAGDPNIIVSGKRLIVTATIVTGKAISESITEGVRSDDNGTTWTAPYAIPMNHRYTAGKIQRGLRLKSGTLLMGYSWDTVCEEGKTLGSEGQMHLRTGMMISKDDGLTWRNGEDFDITGYEVMTKWAIRGSAEPAIVELDDGSVFMLVRTGADHLYQARSTDEGKTWTDVRPSPLLGHNAPAALCNFQTGDRRGILCVWDHAIERYPLCAAASFDGGKTWSEPRDIAGPTGGFQASYPSCIQADDGTLVAVWQQDLKSGGPRDIRCARFTLDWLLHEGEPAATATPAQSGHAQPPVILGPAGDMRGAIGDSFLFTQPDGAVNMIFARPAANGTELARKQTTDDGRTWSAAETLCPMGEKNLGPAMPLLTRDGRLQLFWMVERRTGNNPAVDYFIDIWHAHSLDSFTRWSEPKRIFAGYVGSINGMTQLAGGRIVLPFAYWLAGVPDGPPNGNNAVTTVYSDDNGDTWQQSPAKLTVPCYPDYNGDNLGAVEPTILQLADGRVWMLIRTQTGRFYESFSTDGAIWSKPEPSRFRSPDAPAWLMRLPDKRIVLFWNHCENTSRIGGQGVYCNRDALHAAISRDEGKSWRGYREIYRDPLRNQSPPKTGDRGASYPYPTATRDGKILLITGQGEGRRNILLLDPDWLEEDRQEDDFSNGLEGWSVFKPFGPAVNWWRDRVQGATLASHPAKPNAQVLHIRRPDEKDGDGAVWNFPAGRRGEVSIRLQRQAGAKGVSLALADRFIQPTDTAGEKNVLVCLPISDDGQFVNDALLNAGQWYAISLQWDLDKRSCIVLLDEKRVAEAPMSNTDDSPGISYLRLRSTAETPDSAGIFVESVRADVGRHQE